MATHTDSVSASSDAALALALGPGPNKKTAVSASLVAAAKTNAVAIAPVVEENVPHGTTIETAPVATVSDATVAVDDAAAVAAASEAAKFAAETALAEAESDLDEEDKTGRKSFTAEGQAAFDKAMFKKREAVREAKAELEARDAELAETKVQLEEARTAASNAADNAATQTASSDHPIATIKTDDALEKYLGGVRAWRRWCNLNPDGGVTVVDGKEQEYSQQDVRKYLADSDDYIERAERQRRLIQEVSASDAEVVTKFPALKNATSEQAIRLKTLMRLPPHKLKLILADYIANGHAKPTAVAAVRTASAAPAVSHKATIPRAASSPSSASSPPVTSARGATNTAAFESFKKSGFDPDGTALAALVGVVQPRG